MASVVVPKGTFYSSRKSRIPATAARPMETAILFVAPAAPEKTHKIAAVRLFRRLRGYSIFACLLCNFFIPYTCTCVRFCRDNVNG